MNTQHAYRLGSMPRRVYRERCNPRWPEEQPCRTVLGLIDEWLADITDVKGSPLVPEVHALKAAVEAEQQAFAAAAEFEKQQRRYGHLEAMAMGEDVGPPTPPVVGPDAGPDSLELARDLIDKAEGSEVTAALPADVRPAYELGQLVARCRYAEADETETLRIAELVRAMASEEWLTGRVESAPLTEPIHDIVMSRLDILHELLSVKPWPSAGSPRPDEDVSDGPYLTIEDAARLLRVGEETVERMISNGELPVIEITGRGTVGGRKLKRIMREGLDAAMRKRQLNQQGPMQPRRRSGLDAQEDLVGD